MNRSLSLKRTRLWNKFLREQTKKIKTRARVQNRETVASLCLENPITVVLTKKILPTIKSLKIILIENEEIVCNNAETAQIWNTYFSKTVTKLNIP